MMLTTSLPDFFGTTVLPWMENKRKMYGAKHRATHKPCYPMMFQKRSTKKEVVDVNNTTGVGLFRTIDEGQAIETDFFRQGYSKRYTWTKRGLALPFTEKFVRHDRWDQVSHGIKSLTKAENQTLEIILAAPWNNAFSSTGVYAGPDTKALCATDHPVPRVPGLTQSNMMQAADFDQDTLELALTAYETQVDDDGHPAILGVPLLVGPPRLRWLFAEVLKSDKRSDTPNNAINSLKYAEGGAVSDFRIHHYLTDDDSWFLVPPNPEDSPMVMYWSKKPYSDNWYKPETETVFYARRFEEGHGFEHYLGIYGVQGT
jgi:hypothetical protein